MKGPTTAKYFKHGNKKYFLRGLSDTEFDKFSYI